MRNWLFIGPPDAGPRLANLFTLLENCRQVDIDAETYLSALLRALASGPIPAMQQWLPGAWKARRAAGILT